MAIDPNQLAAWRKEYNATMSLKSLGELCEAAMPLLLDEVKSLQRRVAELEAEVARLTPQADGMNITVTIDATAPGATHGARGMGNTIAEAVANLREQLEKLK